MAVEITCVQEQFVHYCQFLSLIRSTMAFFSALIHNADNEIMVPTSINRSRRYQAPFPFPEIAYGFAFLS